MPYFSTTATKKIIALKRRIRAVRGGSSASKTISILLALIGHAQSAGNKKLKGAPPDPILISVVSESLPHLKRGAIRDFLNIMESQKYFKEKNWNMSDFIYTFETGSKIEFFGVDQPGKVKGPRRDVLFLNEAINIDYEIFTQLAIRTNNYIFLDWNPSCEFWFDTEILPKRTDVDFITLTYKDNEALSASIVQELEQRKTDKNWWKVYGEGQIGDIEGRIYTGWKIIGDIPHEARLERYGLDFGYTNDPTAIVAVYYYNGGYIFDELCYQTGMSNRDIANLFKNLKRAIIVADSAEPKSIDDIKRYGLNVLPTKKGRDSIRNGINNIRNLQISVTASSLNLISEYRKYLWLSDKEGKVIRPEQPRSGFDHCLDALRYASVSLISVLDKQELYGYTRDRARREVTVNRAR